MKRNLYTLLLSICIIGFLNAQVPKKILIEETTQASCPPCATLNPPFDMLMEANLDKVVVMKYQVWWPGFDPMYLENTTDVDARVGDFLGASAAPNIYVNAGRNESLGAMTQSRINSMYAGQSSPISIDIDHNINDATGAVDISITIKNESNTDIPANVYRLITVLQEDDITYAQQPGTNGEKEFKWVMRKMLPDANGTVLTEGLASGESKTFDFSVAIPWYTKDLGYLAATAWVENPTNRFVLQAEHSAHKPLMGVYPDLATSYDLINYDGYCDGEVDANFNIRNDGTEEVSSFDINVVNSDGSLTLLQSWTGNIAVGASETVSVTGLQLAFGGNSLSAVISGINDRPDKNGHNNQINNSVFYAVSEQPFADELSEDFDISFLNEVPPNMFFEENQIPIVTANSTFLSFFNDPLGGFGNSDGAVWMDFVIASPGRQCAFVFDKLNLTNSENTTLDFSYAYAMRVNSGNDRVIVEASTDCGTSWTSIWDVVGRDVTTAPATGNTTRFFPRPDQWGSSNLDMSSFDGEEEIILRFRGISGNSQAFWFDDIIVKSNPISSTDNSLEIADISVYPNPASEEVTIDFSIEKTTNLKISINDLSGRLIENISNASFIAGNHSTKWYPSNEGVFLVQFESNNGITSKRITVVK